MPLNVSRGRGPRVRDDELEQMLLLYSQGKSLKAIAKSTHRHWQTVRKYILKELREREGKDARKEALKSALTLHFQDLVEALQTMKSLFYLPETQSNRVPAFSQLSRENEWLKSALTLHFQDLVEALQAMKSLFYLREAQSNRVPASSQSSREAGRRERLLLEALRQNHARTSPLWGWWDSWLKAWETYASSVPRFDDRVVAEVERLKSVYGEAIIPQNLAPVLLYQADGLVRRSESYMLDKHLEVKDNRGVEELWLGHSGYLAPDQGQKVRQALLKLEAEMKEWPELKVIVGSYQHLVDTRNKMEEEIEVLSLRRAFPGRCRLCPV